MSDSLRSPPGSCVHGISQSGILEWVAVSFSRGSSQPRAQTHISCNTFGYLVITPRRYWRTAVCQAGISKLFVLFLAYVCDFQTHKMLQLSIPENTGLCLCEASGHAQLIKWRNLVVTAVTCVPRVLFSVSSCFLFKLVTNTCGVGGEHHSGECC